MTTGKKKKAGDTILVPTCRKTMLSRRNGATEKSARSLNRFLPAVEMTNHELTQVGTSVYLRKLTIVFFSCEPFTSLLRQANGFAVVP